MSESSNNCRISRNRTIRLSAEELNYYKKRLIKLTKPTDVENIINKTINQDVFEAIGYLPPSFVDLAFVDPPYNLSKKFNTTTFKEMGHEAYEKWLELWIPKIRRLLKPHASIYICGDWRSSSAIFNVAKKYFKIHNRITFEREKGRGSKRNWKNCSEDIWFCSLSNDYYFNADAVKVKRRVIAPYRDETGNPKDWEECVDGNYRITYASNIWTDITIPFWSMPENTEHPTQKPEKLLAKIILANTKPNDVVFDPFLGSGTTSVVAKKLGRRFVGIEVDEYYCCLAEKRLEMAEKDKSIQGYSDGVFWDRNLFNEQARKRTKKDTNTDLFNDIK
ncbi:MAG: site-specific DNA-methyltransferase [Deltaproteobacteria bacterium]|nr:site-specific DNA-methyltransferase [Deltaproteobacteria bacterium]